MPYWIWIVIALVAVAVVALVVGLLLGRRRRVALAQRGQAPTPVDTGPDQGSAPERTPPGYRAGGSISFSTGSSAGSSAAVVDKGGGGGTGEGAGEGAAAETSRGDVPTNAVRAEGVRAEGVPAETVPVGDRSVGDGVIQPSESASTGAPSESTAAQPAPPEPAQAQPEPAEAEVPEIAPTAGRMSRLRGRLSRSQTVFGRSLLGLLGAGDLDEDSWQDIEDTLLMADLGSAAALEIAETLRDRVAAEGIADAAAARALLRSVLIDAVEVRTDSGIASRTVNALPHDGRPAVVLVVGVNGTGKTTTTGKLSRVLVADGHSVVLGAADTFRAAAAEQLATWAERSGATLVRGDEGADPAAVAFDAVKTGIAESRDVVLIDTAGRLHTKTGLMDQLGKVKRVIEKQAEVDEVLLVLDATTGQNGLVQAKVFAEVVNVTGIVLTKLDGTAKGGIVIAVQRELGVPVKLVGLGEGVDDLAPFEAAAFVDALLGD